MKKLISIVLAVLLISSAVAAVPALAAGEKYEKGSVVTLDFIAGDIDTPITAFEGAISFTDKLTINKDSIVFPHIKETPFKIKDNLVLFAVTNLSNYDISSDKVFLSAQFKVNEDVETLPAECVIEDIYYIDGTNFVVPEKITLPYKLSVSVREISKETTETPTTYEPAESTESTSVEPSSEIVEPTEASTTYEPSEPTKSAPVEETTSAVEPATKTNEPAEAATSKKESPEKKQTGKSSSKKKTVKKKTAKKNNPIKITVKTKSVKSKKLKKKAQTFKAITVKKAKGKVSFEKIKSGSSKSVFKKLKVNSKTGKITFIKGKYKKAIYKLKVKVTAKGNKTYKSKSKTVKVKIKVK